jgi:hypothetical protein
MNKLAFALALALAACGGKSSSTPTTPEPPVTEKAGNLSSLELGEIKIVDTEKNEAVIVHADGKIDVGGNVIATVTADGKLKSASGEELMMLEADGSLKVKSGQIPPVVFGADGSVTAEGKTVSIDADGKLVGGEDAAPLKIEGATTPGLKRTALFVLLGLTMGGSPEPAPAPTAPNG